ncbi:hypothetical protein JCM11251_001960 [Rhodosporidiobolus azoricus]
MSVTLNPSSTLAFQRPLTQLVKRSLSVTNHNSEAVAYKVKTTSPRQYCVRPNSGRVEPGETVEVQVLLQPMKEDPPAGAKCRDKFLVQSVVITGEREGLGLPELAKGPVLMVLERLACGQWQSVESQDKARQAEGQPSQIHEQKIRCSYLPAADSDAVSAIPEETTSRLSSQGHDSSFASTVGTSSPQPASSSSTHAAPPTYSPTPASPPSASYSESSSQTQTQPNPVAAKAQDAAHAAGAAAAGAAAAVGLPNLARVIDEKTPAPAPSAPSASTTTTSSSTPAPAPAAESSELAQLRAELSSARAEISRLKSQLDAAETTAATLRSRGAGAPSSGVVGGGEKAVGAGTSQAVVEMKGSEGVPVQVVIGVAFGVFVVTWLFF